MSRMTPKNTPFRLAGLAAAVLSIGLPLRVVAVLNQTGFRGNVHWAVGVFELLFIGMCYVLGERLGSTDLGLSRVVNICGSVAIILCLMIALTPAPAAWW